MSVCAFYRSKIIVMVYFNDLIFLDNDDHQLTDIIKELKNIGLDVDDQGHPADYVQVNIHMMNGGHY